MNTIQTGTIVVTARHASPRRRQSIGRRGRCRSRRGSMMTSTTINTDSTNTSTSMGVVSERRASIRGTGGVLPVGSALNAINALPLSPFSLPGSSSDSTGTEYLYQIDPVQKQSQRVSAFLKLFEPIHVPLFGLTDTQATIRKTLSTTLCEERPELTDVQVVSQVVEASGGHPFLIQILAFNLRYSLQMGTFQRYGRVM